MGATQLLRRGCGRAATAAATAAAAAPVHRRHTRLISGAGGSGAGGLLRRAATTRSWAADADAAAQHRGGVLVASARLGWAGPGAGASAGAGGLRWRVPKGPPLACWRTSSTGRREDTEHAVVVVTPTGAGGRRGTADSGWSRARGVGRVATGWRYAHTHAQHPEPAPRASGAEDEDDDDRWWLRGEYATDPMREDISQAVERAPDDMKQYAAHEFVEKRREMMTKEELRQKRQAAAMAAMDGDHSAGDAPRATEGAGAAPVAEYPAQAPLMGETTERSVEWEAAAGGVKEDEVVECVDGEEEQERRRLSALIDEADEKLRAELRQYIEERPAGDVTLPPLRPSPLAERERERERERWGEGGRGGRTDAGRLPARRQKTQAPD
jgi:hypothetical protein